MDIGIDWSTAYELVKLHPRSAEILRTSEAQGYWPTLPELLGHDDRTRASVSVSLVASQRQDVAEAERERQ